MLMMKDLILAKRTRSQATTKKIFHDMTFVSKTRLKIIVESYSLLKKFQKPTRSLRKNGSNIEHSVSFISKS